MRTRTVAHDALNWGALLGEFPPMDPNTQPPKRGTDLPKGHWWL